MNAFKKFWHRLSGRESHELRVRIDYLTRALEEDTRYKKNLREERDELAHQKYELEKKLAVVSKEHFERGANLKGEFGRILDDLHNESKP